MTTGVGVYGKWGTHHAFEGRVMRCRIHMACLVVTASLVGFAGMQSKPDDLCAAIVKFANASKGRHDSCKPGAKRSVSAAAYDHRARKGALGMPSNCAFAQTMTRPRKLRWHRAAARRKH